MKAYLLTVEVCEDLCVAILDKCFHEGCLYVKIEYLNQEGFGKPWSGQAQPV